MSKKVNLLRSRCTSLLLCSKPVQRNWLRFFKNFKKQCTLQGIIKLNLLWEMLLLAFFLPENVRKTQNVTKRHSFRTGLRFLISLLNVRPQMTFICSFMDCFSFSNFYANSCCFLNLRKSWLNSELDFIQNKLHFGRLGLLVSCYTVNQYNKIEWTFSQSWKKSAHSKRS